MIGGDALSLWRILQSWWRTKLIKPVDLLMNSQAVAGFHLTNLKKRMPHKYREALDHLFSLYEKGTLKPRIDSVWSFDQASGVLQILCLARKRMSLLCVS